MPPVDSATVDADRNDIGVIDPGSSIVNDLGGNISADPVFVNPCSDFHLAAGSPCVDTGTCTGVTPTDADGDPRPSGPGCDIGADELVP